MKIFRLVNDILDYVRLKREQNFSIGLVPTMGSLHDGHISLVKKAREECDIVIVSLFVNPTQFNDPKDFSTYPRKEEEDFKKLAAEEVDAVFAPSEKEIYPDGDDSKKQFELGSVAEVMEGKYRPGHFQGVAQIVNKLFCIINPDKAFFGEKDFQQIAVIRNLIKNEGLKVEIIPCPIIREKDGLALSSRNELLKPEHRDIAPEIFRTLSYSLEYSKDHSVRATHDTVVERIDAVPGLRVQYFEIVDGRTLQPVEEWDESPWIVGCITVFCGDIRLIDNITYRHI